MDSILNHSFIEALVSRKRETARLTARSERSKRAVSLKKDSIPSNNIEKHKLLNIHLLTESDADELRSKDYSPAKKQKLKIKQSIQDNIDQYDNEHARRFSNLKVPDSSRGIDLFDKVLNQVKESNSIKKKPKSPSPKKKIEYAKLNIKKQSSIVLDISSGNNNLTLREKKKTLEDDNYCFDDSDEEEELKMKKTNTIEEKLSKKVRVKFSGQKLTESPVKTKHSLNSQSSPRKLKESGYSFKEKKEIPDNQIFQKIEYKGKKIKNSEENIQVIPNKTLISDIEKVIPEKKLYFNNHKLHSKISNTQYALNETKATTPNEFLLFENDSFIDDQGNKKFVTALNFDALSALESAAVVKDEKEAAEQRNQQNTGLFESIFDFLNPFKCNTTRK